MPEIMDANRDAVVIWAETRTQVIPGMNGPIDINILAVSMMMDLYGIEDKLDCLARVRTMYEEYQETLREKREENKESS
jgi:peroxiredoxin family protein